MECQVYDLWEGHRSLVFVLTSNGDASKVVHGSGPYNEKKKL